MKTVILCGGRGTRLSEETDMMPKPMVEIGGKPILWHIMNIYAAHGFNEYLLALGYKSEIIKQYFINYYHLQNDLTISLKTGRIEALKKHLDDWNVELLHTGNDSMTGGRLLRLKDKLTGTFMLTYGDGVSSINIKEVVAFHKGHGKAATVTAVRPTARFGGMRFDGNKVAEFMEKPQTGEGWINGGFFVFEPKIFEYLSDDRTVLETDPLENLAKDGQLMAYKYDGFWGCMDTIRDRQALDHLWESGKAPWKVWK